MVIFWSLAIRSASGGWVLNRLEKNCRPVRGATMHSAAPASKARPLLLRFLYASANMSYEE